MKTTYAILVSTALVPLVTACGTPATARDGAASDAPAADVRDAAVLDAPAGDAAPETDARVDATGPADVGPLPTGRWIDVSPAGVSRDPNTPASNFGFQRIVVDPMTPSTVYVGTCYQGLWKSVDSGAHWSKVSTGTNGAALDAGRLWALAIDPTATQTLYTTSGYGSAQGVFRSTDGGVDWTQMLPDALSHMLTSDVYDIAIDPREHQHVLVAFHSQWDFGNNPAWGSNSGLIESHDAGATWTIHPPQLTWGSGHNVFFLDTGASWLLGTQGNGFWRTLDSGATWSQVSTVSMQHGASQLYRAHDGTLFVGADGTLLRSRDGGATWTSVGPTTSDGYNGVVGDGSYVYAQPANTGAATTGTHPFFTTAETDGTTWTPFNDQVFDDGPMSMAFDAVHGIVWASNWRAGVWQLRVR